MKIKILEITKFFKSEKLGFFNAFIRITSLILKLIFMLYLAKNFSPNYVGNFNYYFYIITLVAFLFGFNFFTFSTREIVRSDDKLKLIKSQLFYLSIIYFILTPFIYVIFKYIFLIDNLMIFIMLSLIIFEMLSNELSRIFIAINKQLFSSTLILIKNGLWGLVLIIFWQYFEQKFIQIYIFWLIFVLIGVLISFGLLQNLYHDTKIKFKMKKFIWFINGLRISSPYFLNAILSKIVELSSIFFLARYADGIQFGVYTFFISLQGVSLTIVYATSVSIYLPRLLSSYNNKNEFEILTKSMLKSVCTYSTIVFFLSCVFVYPVLYIIDKSVYWDNLEIYYILGIAFYISNISSFHNAYFYIIKKDMFLFKLNSSVALLCLILGISFIYNLHAIGAALIQFVCYTFTILILHRKYLKVTKTL